MGYGDVTRKYSLSSIFPIVRCGNWVLQKGVVNPFQILTNPNDILYQLAEDFLLSYDA